MNVEARATICREIAGPLLVRRTSAINRFTSKQNCPLACDIPRSENPDLKPGDAVFGPLGVQTHTKIPGAFLRKLDPAVAPMNAYLGVLGLTAGLTSWFGVRNVGLVKPGELTTWSDLLKPQFKSLTDTSTRPMSKPVSPDRPRV